MEVVLFHRHPKKVQAAQTKILKNGTRTVEAQQFLSENKRTALLKKISDFSGLEALRYKSLCETLIENLVNYCQKLPETSTTYYSQSGGLVDHALNRTEAALSLFQNFILQDQPGLLSEEQKLWQYALYSAAILQSIGTLFVDYKINVYDSNGQMLRQWNPLLENLFQSGSQYDYELLKESDLTFRHRLNLLLAKALMPASGFSWIASNSQVLTIWLALLNEDYRSAGTLGALLIRADAIAIQRYFSEFMVKSVPQRTPYHGAGTFSDGAPESVLEKEQALGVEFLQWLNRGLESGKIMFNNAPLIMVPGGLMVSQEIFQLFVQESVHKSWQAVQNGFLALGLYARGADGRAILRVDHNNAMLNGVLVSKYAVALPSSVQLKTGESISATELIHKLIHTTQYTKEHLIQAAPLQKLAVSGQWQIMEEVAEPRSTLMPGARING